MPSAELVQSFLRFFRDDERSGDVRILYATDLDRDGKQELWLTYRLPSGKLGRMVVEQRAAAGQWVEIASHCWACDEPRRARSARGRRDQAQVARGRARASVTRIPNAMLSMTGEHRGEHAGRPVDAPEPRRRLRVHRLHELIPVGKAKPSRKPSGITTAERHGDPDRELAAGRRVEDVRSHACRPRR